MRDLHSRVEALEKIIAEHVHVAPAFVVLHPARDTPEELAGKKEQIADAEREGRKILVYEVVA